MNQEHKRGLLKRIHKLATPTPWGWEDRELLVEVLETLIEEIDIKQIESGGTAPPVIVKGGSQ